MGRHTAICRHLDRRSDRRSFEYIRFHIPTYLGWPSGQPNVGPDMDSIYGGSAVVSTRDYQWKSFTPIMINMSGWSDKDKTPWVWGEPYESINRMYLKLKAQMLPYYYSYARESYDTGVPMVRALMLEYPEEEFTMDNQTQYEYLWGENLLVAPVYDEAENNAEMRNRSICRRKTGCGSIPENSIPAARSSTASTRRCGSCRCSSRAAPSS
ncbi:MAG: TIM-barrel domain-containing protein [Merdibacter sp.]